MYVYLWLRRNWYQYFCFLTSARAYSPSGIWLRHLLTKSACSEIQRCKKASEETVISDWKGLASRWLAVSLVLRHTQGNGAHALWKAFPVLGLARVKSSRWEVTQFLAKAVLVCLTEQNSFSWISTQESGREIAHCSEVSNCDGHAVAVGFLNAAALLDQGS